MFKGFVTVFQEFRSVALYTDVLAIMVFPPSGLMGNIDQEEYIDSYVMM